MEYGIVADFMPKEAGEVYLCKLMKQEVNKDDVIWYCKGISGGEILKETLESVCQIKEKIMYENKKVIFDVHLQIKDIKICFTPTFFNCFVVFSPILMHGMFSIHSFISSFFI